MVILVIVLKESTSWYNLWSHASKMKEVKLHIQHVMLWEFRNNKNAKETTKKICSVYEQVVITDCLVWDSFSKFHSSNMLLRDELKILIRPQSRCFKRIGRIQYVQKYSRISTWPQQIPIQYLLLLKKEWKSEQAYWDEYISIATSLLSRQRNDPFLKNITTGDEKWIFYVNFQCKRQWIDEYELLLISPRTVFHGGKVMYGGITAVLFILSF